MSTDKYKSIDDKIIKIKKKKKKTFEHFLDQAKEQATSDFSQWNG